MKMDLPWLIKYGNPNSYEYKQLVAHIDYAVSNCLKDFPGILLLGTELREGSVIAVMLIDTDLCLSASAIEDIINDGIADGKFSSLKVTDAVAVQGMALLISLP